jgi:peroxiredoxin
LQSKKQNIVYHSFYPEIIMALEVGTTAPDITLLDADMKPVTLSSLKGTKVVLAFFPASFTGVCQAELCTFQGALQRLNSMNATVLGVAADLPFSNKAFSVANDLHFPILSDWNLDAINKYDVALHNFAGIEGLTRSVRATFVIDTNGTISFAEVTANPGVEPNYDAVYAAVEAAE